MGSFAGLLVLCTGMFVASLAVGYIPMCLLVPSSNTSSSISYPSAAASRLRYANAFGAGLFIGTAFSVIVPEGAQLLMTKPPSSHHSNQSQPLLTDEEYSASTQNSQHDAQTTPELDHDDHDDHETCSIPSSFGLPICLGFVAMMLVERFSHGSIHAHSHAHSPRSRSHSHGGGRGGGGGGSNYSHKAIPRRELEAVQLDRLPRTDKDDDDNQVSEPLPPGPSSSSSSSSSARSASSAFIGLMVHCAADGVALGSVALSEHARLEMLVFVALMMHKAPASFGLSAFLLQQNRSPAFIWKYLLVFSGVAPIAALLTYISCVGSGAISAHTLGMLMLFSAGTFLFVACVHILPEIMYASDHQPLEWSVLAVVCAGTIVPALIDTGHSH